jgi:hypothetical protein
MRKAFSQQRRLDCRGIDDVQLNLECRHESIPILKALQHVYSLPEVRDHLLHLTAQDVNQHSQPAATRTCVRSASINFCHVPSSRHWAK